MKVLHVINHLRHGGAERLLSCLLPALKARKVDVELFVLEDGARSYIDRLSEARIEVTALNAKTYSMLAAFKLFQKLRATPFDLVHAHLFPAQLYSAVSLGLARRDTPLVITEHSTSNGRRGKRWLGLEERMVYGFAAAVACISSATRDELVRSLGFSPRNLEIVPNGLDLNEIICSAPSELPKKMFPGRRVICSVGRLVPEKGFDLLLKAMRFVEPDVQLLICGDGPERHALVQLAERHGVGAKVSFLGSRDDVPSLLLSSDLYVQPSLFEGFGLAALEAMAVGLPVIHSGCAGLANLVGAGGIGVDVRDAEGFAGAISRLLNDFDERCRLGNEGKTRASKFSVDVAAESYKRLYRNQNQNN